MGVRNEVFAYFWRSLICEWVSHNVEVVLGRLKCVKALNYFIAKSASSGLGSSLFNVAPVRLSII